MPKRMATLVFQFLEGISGEAIEEYQDFFREVARRRNGVYALYKGNRDKSAPILGKFANRPRFLRATYKRRTYRARVRPDGSILYAKETYRSPSGAARAVINPQRTRAVSGWWFWYYERAPGDWVRLNEIRR